MPVSVVLQLDRIRVCAVVVCMSLYCAEPLLLAAIAPFLHASPLGTRARSVLCLCAVCICNCTSLTLSLTLSLSHALSRLDCAAKHARTLAQADRAALKRACAALSDVLRAYVNVALAFAATHDRAWLSTLNAAARRLARCAVRLSELAPTADEKGVVSLSARGSRGTCSVSVCLLLRGFSQRTPRSLPHCNAPCALISPKTRSAVSRSPYALCSPAASNACLPTPIVPSSSVARRRSAKPLVNGTRAPFVFALSTSLTERA